jgi:transcriptional regulator with XRE-family HTH domain
MTMNENDIAARLSQIRQALKFKQKDFAERLDISAPSLSEMEGGKYKPNFDFLAKLAKEFNINLYYLFFGEGEMFIDAATSYLNKAKDFATDTEDMRKFFYYFQRSPVLRYLILAHFRISLLKEKEAIEYDLLEYEKKKEE